MSVLHLNVAKPMFLLEHQDGPENYFHKAKVQTKIKIIHFKLIGNMKYYELE